LTVREKKPEERSQSSFKGSTSGLFLIKETLKARKKKEGGKKNDPGVEGKTFEKTQRKADKRQTEETQDILKGGKASTKGGGRSGEGQWKRRLLTGGARTWNDCSLQTVLNS